MFHFDVSFWCLMFQHHDHTTTKTHASIDVVLFRCLNVSMVDRRRCSCRWVRWMPCRKKNTAPTASIIPRLANRSWWKRVRKSFVVLLMHVGWCMLVVSRGATLSADPTVTRTRFGSLWAPKFLRCICFVCVCVLCVTCNTMTVNADCFSVFLNAGRGWFGGQHGGERKNVAWSVDRIEQQGTGNGGQIGIRATRIGWNCGVVEVNTHGNWRGCEVVNQNGTVNILQYQHISWYIKDCKNIILHSTFYYM